MAADDLSDDYVAQLLKDDAKKAAQNYALGFGLLPKRYLVVLLYVLSKHRNNVFVGPPQAHPGLT
jgi:hypothetical protein